MICIGTNQAHTVLLRKFHHTKMKARTLLSTLSRAHRRQARFDPSKYTDKNTEKINMDKNDISQSGVRWNDNPNDLFNTLEVHGASVPEKWHHFIEDPYGIKNDRDKMLLARVERWQKRSKLRKYRDVEREQGPSRRQLTLSQRIMDALNVVVTEDVANIMDSALATNKANVIYSPVLLNSGVSFTDVQLTADLLIARCAWFCKPHYELLVRNELAAKKSEIRKILANKVRMKYVPKLEFNFDEKSITFQNVERLVQQHEEGRKNFKKVDRHSLSDEEKYLYYEKILKSRLAELADGLYVPTLPKSEEPEAEIEDRIKQKNEDHTAQAELQAFIAPKLKKRKAKS